MNEFTFTKLSSGLYLVATRLGGETDASITGSLSLITYSPYRICEYYVAAEPPVRCGESHLSGQTEPPCY